MSRCVYKPTGREVRALPELKCVRCGHTRRSATPPEKIARECGKEITGPCQHLGEKVGTRECESCKGKTRIKLFACAVYGQCSIAKKLDGIACCDNGRCPDYSAARRDTDPDDGRNG